MSAGTKLVTAMLALAVLLGVASWWYRYEAAHRSTHFWGTRAATVIARPNLVTGLELGEPLVSGAEVSPEENPTTLKIGGDVYHVVSQNDLTEARGIKHMDSLLLADQNFRWDQPVENPRWQWAMQFVSEAGTACVLFADDLQSVGLLDQEELQVKTLNCMPLKPALEEYFARPDVFGASKRAE